MASMPYPPWDSAPAVMQRGRRGNLYSSPAWVTNAKEAILKPWKRRSQRKQKDPKETPSRQDEYVYNQNPFARPNPFAAGGGMPLFGGPFSNMQQRNVFPPIHDGYKSPTNVPQEPNNDLPKGHFEPEALIQMPTRPSLRNVFPMYDSPQPQLLPTTPDKSIAAMRRNSTPGGAMYPKAAVTPTEAPRRPMRSSASSAISNERSNRRERRANMIREIPILPNMLRSNVSNHTPSRYQHHTRNDASQVHALHPRQDFSRTPYSSNHPFQGRSELHNSFSFPPWPQPHEQLQELEEELDVDEIIGGRDMDILHEESRKLESEKIQKKVHKNLMKLRHIQEESGSEGDIKGFDEFMMY